MDIHSVPEQMQKVMAALQKGNKAGAREILDVLIQEHPNDERLWLWMSWTMETREEFEHCIEQIRRINPEHPTIKRRQEGQSGATVSGLAANSIEQSLLLKRARSSAQSASQSGHEASSPAEDDAPNEIREILALYEKPVHMVEEKTVIPITQIIASYTAGNAASESVPTSPPVSDADPTDGATPSSQEANVPARGTERTTASDSTSTTSPLSPVPADNLSATSDSSSPAPTAASAAATAVEAEAAAQTGTISPNVPESTTTAPEAGAVPDTTTPTAEVPATLAAPATTTLPVPETSTPATMDAIVTATATATAPETSVPASPAADAPATSADSTPAAADAQAAAPATTTPPAKNDNTPTEIGTMALETIVSTPDAQTQVQAEQPTAPSSSTSSLSAAALAASSATVAASLMSAESTVSAAESNTTASPPTIVSPSAPTQIALSSPDDPSSVQEKTDSPATSASCALPSETATPDSPTPAASPAASVDSASHSAPTVVASSTHLDVKEILKTYSTSGDQLPVPDHQGNQLSSSPHPASRTSPYKEESEDHEKYIFELTLTLPDSDDLKYVLQQKVLLAIVFVIIVLILIFSIQFLINRQNLGNTGNFPQYPRSTQLDHVHWNVLDVKAVESGDNVPHNPATRYVEIYLNVQNLGTSTLHMEPVLLTDANDVMVYQPVTTHPSFAAIPEENICDQNDIITPKEILVCRSIFEIPHDATEMNLRVSNLTTENQKTSFLSLRMPFPANKE